MFLAKYAPMMMMIITTAKNLEAKIKYVEPTCRLVERTKYINLKYKDYINN